MEEASLFSAIPCRNQTEGDDCKHFLSVWVQLSDGESCFSPEVEFRKSRQRLPDGEQMTGGNDPKKTLSSICAHLRWRNCEAKLGNNVPKLLNPPRTLGSRLADALERRGRVAVFRLDE